MERHRSPWPLARVTIPVVAGLLTGILTLALQAVLPEALNRLANSGAIWVTVAFAVGALATSWRSAALAGTVSLLLAVGGYYTAAAVAGAGISTGALLIWGGTAIVGGPVFGAAGWAWWTRRDRLEAAAAALLGAVYLAEGVYTLLVVPAMAPAGIVEVVVGVVLGAALPRSRESRVTSLVLLIPLAVVGLAGYLVIDQLFLAR
jgi:hypothetical protein